MTPSSTQIYLFFGGRCEEALDFYRQHLGAQVDFLMRFQESPQPIPPSGMPEGWGSKVMHATFRIGSTTLQASDGCEAGNSFSGFSLSLSFSEATEADRIFAALADGGQVRMPMAKTFWSPRFGIVTDRFGIGWMVSVAA